MKCALCGGALDERRRVFTLPVKPKPQHFHPVCGGMHGFWIYMNAHRSRTELDLLDLMSKQVGEQLHDGRIRIVWRHEEKLRCVLQLGDRHVLFHDGTDPPLVVEGTLREVIASVPDEDFYEATAALAKAEREPPPYVVFGKLA